MDTAAVNQSLESHPCPTGVDPSLCRRGDAVSADLQAILLDVSTAFDFWGSPRESWPEAIAYAKRAYPGLSDVAATMIVRQLSYDEAR